MMDLPNLKRNPRFLHSITGVNDGGRIIKGFIRGDDKDEKKIKARLKKSVPPRTQIALFNIDKQSESISDEAKMIQSEEENSPDLDESTRIRLDRVIEKSQNHLYKTSSNIIGIGISNVRYDGNAFLKEPCIVLYCLDKHIVPLGERPLPIHIEGWPCDHRENIALRKHFFLFDKLLSDHNFVVKSWKRKDMPNTTILEMNQSIQDYIAGDKGDKRVIKAFMIGGDAEEKEVEDDLNKACILTKGISIEIVNIDKQSESFSDEAEKIQWEEEHSPDLDESTRIHMDKVIEKSQNYIYKTSSNIIGIGTSNVRYDGNAFLKEPCIVLYCLDKHIVPFGERPLPLSLGGWPCDHRENIALRKHFFLFDKLLSDHNFEVKSWKRKDMPNTTILEMNPSIQDYIAGYKGDKRVIKAFVTGGDAEEEKVKDDLNKACILSKDILTEIVNIDKRSESFSVEAEKIQWEEEHSPDLDESIRTHMEEVIEKNQKYLHKRYSNIIAIGISNVRCDGKIFLKEPCIVLYCLDKHIVPFGESSLPTKIKIWPCDHREDFAMLEMCPSKCSSPDFLEPGCSIGPDSEKSGSAGFMVQSQNNSTTGFLTAAHVAVKNLNKKKIHQPSVLLTDKIEIKHPSFADDKKNSMVVGQVREAYYGNYDDRYLDMAYIVDCVKREKNEELTVVSEEDLNPFKLNEFKVRKTGRTTGPTTGYINNRRFYGKTWSNCYSISKENSDDFSKKGDSGSGVFLVNKDETQKPLGILIGGMTESKLKIVCKIDKVLDKSGLKIVKFVKKSKYKKCLICLLIICIILATLYIYMKFYKEHSSTVQSSNKYFEL